MKVLAAQADARWAAKPSALDAPDKQQPVQMLQSQDPTSGIRQMNIDQDLRDNPELEGKASLKEEDTAPTIKTRQRMRKEPKDSPWKQMPKNPGDEWQPAPWSPGPAKRK